ncbi:MAG: trypsin-like peptidase domain-containing protein, partial [Ktedonobacteraceae bacterium]
MADQFKEAIVRIFTSDENNIAGAGFLVSDKHLLTCAHVIAEALNVPQSTPEIPTSAVSFDFPLVSPGTMLSAHVVYWQPVQRSKSLFMVEEDIAVLELEAPPPTTVKPACLVTFDDIWEHDFRTFGFPQMHDEGIWVSGKLLGQQAAGWVQIEGISGVGYGVQLGFSGSPVWDKQLNSIVGMVVAVEEAFQTKAAFMIPTAMLIKAWPQLGQHVIPPCPYRGLFAFRERDEPFFFGREAFTKQLAGAMHQKSLVLVIGPSGSGKSSVVFAGLIPYLRQRRNWLITSFRPGDRPFQALAASLLPLLEGKMSETDRLVEIKKMGQNLQQGDLSLQD